MLLELNFEELKESSLRQAKKEDSTNSTQTQNEARYIKDDLFFNKSSEASFRLIQARRNTNSEFKLGFKGSSPNDARKAVIGKMTRDSSTKRILPQIPENELKLPSDRSFKWKKQEERMQSSQEKPQTSPPGSPERRSAQPKIFIEIPRPGNRLATDGNGAGNVKEVHSGRLRSNTVANHGAPAGSISVANGDEIDERGVNKETEARMDCLLIEKSVVISYNIDGSFL